MRMFISIYSSKRQFVFLFSFVTVCVVFVLLLCYPVPRVLLCCVMLLTSKNSKAIRTKTPNMCCFAILRARLCIKQYKARKKNSGTTTKRLGQQQGRKHA